MIIAWIAFCFIAAAIASNKGRSAGGFFLLSLVLSPVVGIIAALVVQPNRPKVEAKSISTGQEKKCPYCAELVKAEAIVCKHCGRDLATPSAPAS